MIHHVKSPTNPASPPQDADAHCPCSLLRHSASAPRRSGHSTPHSPPFAGAVAAAARGVAAAAAACKTASPTREAVPDGYWALQERLAQRVPTAGAAEAAAEGEHASLHSDGDVPPGSFVGSSQQIDAAAQLVIW